MSRAACGELQQQIEKHDSKILEPVRCEAREGKSKRWHPRNLAISGKAALAAMPHDPNPADMTAFSNAITAFADAVRGYEALGTPDATNAQDLVAKFRTLREKIEKKDTDNADFANVVNN